MNETPQTFMLREALVRTESLLDEVLIGVLPSVQVVREWQLAMHAIGLVPHPDTFSGTGGTGGVNEDILLEDLVRAIEILVEDDGARTRTNLFNQFNILSFNQNLILETIGTEIDDLYNDLELEMFRQTLTVVNDIRDLSLQVDTLQDAITGNVAQLLINQSNRYEAFLDQQTNAINQQIAQGNAMISNQISALAIGDPTGTIEVTGGLNIEELEPYIIDLLNVLVDIQQSIDNQELNVDVDVGVNNDAFENGGSPDISANPFGALSLTQVVEQIKAELAQGVLGTREDNDQLATNVKDLIKLWGSGEITSLDELENAFFDLGIGGHLFHLFWNIAGTLFLMMGLGNSVSRPYLNNIETTARMDALDGLVPLQNLIELQVRQGYDIEAIRLRYKKLGYRDEDIDIMINAYQIQMQEPFLREAVMRDLITENAWTLGMIHLGYKPEDTPLIRQLIENPPSVQDAITFAVREVYDPQQVEQLQLDSDYEIIKDEFEKVLKANGLNPENGINYWRAHWRLPSPTQLYEMLWRGLINRTELEQALKASDYSPTWRDNLRDIAFKTYTRVDIRRLHKIGLLTDQEVLEANMENGYDLDKAQKLTDFVIAENGTLDNPTLISFNLSNTFKAFFNGLISEAQTDDILSRSGLNTFEIAIIKENAKIAHFADTLGDVTKDNRRRIISKLSNGYIKGVLSESYVRQEFARVGYPQANIDEEIQFLKVEQEILEREKTVDILLGQYSKYLIDTNELSILLSQHNYTAGEIQDVIRLWDTIRDNRKTLPTKTEAVKFFQLDLISEDRYKDILRGHGIAEEFIDMYPLLI